jgi:FlaA1/EpsC-like NDP-sugar epimerase
MIIYRTWPKTHGTLADIFLATTILEIVGTTFETTIVFMIFFSVWKDWTITFKVLTPVLHILFSCAQLWGARVFWMMSRQHREAANNDIVEDWIPEASSARLDGHIEVLGKHQSTPGCCAAKEIV